MEMGVHWLYDVCMDVSVASERDGKGVYFPGRLSGE